MTKDKEIRKLNCAIYTHKSTEEGLDQDLKPRAGFAFQIIMTMEVLLAEMWIALH
jgi:hypothetical protein